MNNKQIASMLPTAVGFPKSKRITDHYSILAQEAVGFPRVATTMSSTKVLNKWRK